MNIITKPIFKKKTIAKRWSRVSNKSNVKRRNQEEKKSITQKDLKNKGEKKTLIGEQLKFDLICTP